MGAESGLHLPQQGVPSASASPGQAPVRRRPRWQVQLEHFFETWLPLRARVAGLFLAIVSGAAGFAAVVGLKALLAREPADARTLVIRSTPAGASVGLDDKRLMGATPLFIDTRLGDGPHSLKLSLAARPPVLRKIDLAASDRAVAVIENLQSGGRVRIETRPAGAQVTLDRRHVGRSPVVLEDVPLDKPHAVEVEAKGYKKARAPIPVERGGDHVVRLTLEPLGTPPRVVVITSLPAELEIDGQRHGPTGPKEHPSIPGPHDVVVRIPALGFEHRTTIEVPASGVLRVFVPSDGYSLPKS